METNDEPRRVKYKYHWQARDGRLIARWDNVPHYKGIPTFPDHKHDGRGVHPSQKVDLKYVLDKIAEEF